MKPPEPYKPVFKGIPQITLTIHYFKDNVNEDAEQYEQKLTLTVSTKIGDLKQALCKYEPLNTTEYENYTLWRAITDKELDNNKILSDYKLQDDDMLCIAKKEAYE